MKIVNDLVPQGTSPLVTLEVGVSTSVSLQPLRGLHGFGQEAVSEYHNYGINLPLQERLRLEAPTYDATGDQAGGRRPHQ